MEITQWFVWLVWPVSWDNWDRDEDVRFSVAVNQQSEKVICVKQARHPNNSSQAQDFGMPYCRPWNCYASMFLRKLTTMWGPVVPLSTSFYIYSRPWSDSPSELPHHSMPCPSPVAWSSAGVGRRGTCQSQAGRAGRVLQSPAEQLRFGHRNRRNRLFKLQRLTGIHRHSQWLTETNRLPLATIG